jgi:LuxR family quorum-sensing system transcriptional regulator CciR
VGTLRGSGPARPADDSHASRGRSDCHIDRCGWQPGHSPNRTRTIDIFDFVERSNRANSLNELFALLVGAASSEGFDRIAYGALNYTPAIAIAPGPVVPAAKHTFPRPWRNHYLESGYYEIDPVVAHAADARGPFLWDWVAKTRQLDCRQRRVLDEARDGGLHNGVSVPLHGPCGRLALVSFASSAPDSEPTRELTNFNILASQFHLAFCGLARVSQQAATVSELSQRERDCLAWTAQGKSSWDIGMILNISRNTVDFHLKNAMRKLHTGSRMVAVLKAIKSNLIEVSQV